MLRMVACDNLRARMMPPRSPFSRVMPALPSPRRCRCHGDADLGRGQRRSVVDAIAGHCHNSPRLAKLVDHGARLIRQHLGFDVGNAEPLGHRVRGGAIVDGQHDDLDARRGLGRRALGRACHRQPDKADQRQKISELMAVIRRPDR
jgi:hypothetical protein